MPCLRRFQVRLTRHAQRRWNERCSGLDLAFEWATAKQVRGELKKRIKDECPKHRPLMRGFKGFYYVISRNKVIFVCAPGATVVTVFRLPEHENLAPTGPPYEKEQVNGYEER